MVSLGPRILPAHDIAGFLRTEKDSRGNLYFSEPHYHYHWDAGSVYFERRSHLRLFHKRACRMLHLDKRTAEASNSFWRIPCAFSSSSISSLGDCGDRSIHAVRIQENDVYFTPGRFYRSASLRQVCRKWCSSRAADFYAQLRALESAGKNGKPTTTPFPGSYQALSHTLVEEFLRALPGQAHRSNSGRGAQRAFGRVRMGRDGKEAYSTRV